MITYPKNLPIELSLLSGPTVVLNDMISHYINITCLRLLYYSIAQIPINNFLNYLPKKHLDFKAASEYTKICCQDLHAWKLG